MSKFSDLTRLPDARGHFGPYGGRFVSETLSFALDDLEKTYLRLRDDPDFQAEFDYDLAHYVGRPLRSIMRSDGRSSSAGRGSGSSARTSTTLARTR